MAASLSFFFFRCARFVLVASPKSTHRIRSCSTFKQVGTASYPCALLIYKVPSCCTVNLHLQVQNYTYVLSVVRVMRADYCSPTMLLLIPPGWGKAVTFSNQSLTFIHNNNQSTKINGALLPAPYCNQLIAWRPGHIASCAIWVYTELTLLQVVSTGHTVIPFLAVVITSHWSLFRESRSGLYASRQTSQENQKVSPAER